VTIRGLNKNHNHDLKNIFKGAATRALDGRYILYARIEEPKGDIMLVNDFRQGAR
jgi:hypothetical protein